MLAKRSEQIIESQLRGVYKMFVKIRSPRFVIARISAVHETYFRGVKIVPEVEDHRATIRYIGFRKAHSIVEYCIRGFYRKALEISGANLIELNFTVPIGQEVLSSELTITWQ